MARMSSCHESKGKATEWERLNYGDEFKSQNSQCAGTKTAYE